MMIRFVLLSLCATVVLSQTARHAFYYTNQGGSTCSSAIQNEVYNPGTACATNGTCTERTFSAAVNAEEILSCPTGASSNTYDPAVTLNYAKVTGYSSVDCTGTPLVIAVAPEDKCSGGSSVGTFAVRCDPVGFPSTITLCGQASTDCETPSCAAVVPNQIDGGGCTSTIGNGHGPVLGALSFQVTCPARYQMLTSWSDTTACESSKTPDAISFTRVSHFPGVVPGCAANVNQVCVSHDVQPAYPHDPLVDYAQFRSCRTELSDYTRPAGMGMLKFWCTPKNCHPFTKPDHVKVFTPGKCSGVHNDLFFSQGINQPNGYKSYIVECSATPNIKFFTDSQCSTGLFQKNLVSDRQCQDSSLLGSSFWGGLNYLESPCGPVPNSNFFGAQSYQLICPDTATPTTSPTAAPSKAPSKAPSTSPTVSPTQSPTVSPTKAPSKNPTPVPSKSPTKAPSASPTTQFGSDLSFSHGTGHCGTAGSCRCRLAVIDCHCENSKFCFCENVAGKCYGGNAEIVTVGPEVNVDCEFAERCIIETYAPTTAPPTREGETNASSIVAPALLVLFMTLVMLK